MTDLKHQVLVLPTLGRPFRLGMIYDKRTDHLVPGMSLWNIEDLKKDTQSQPQPSVDVQFISENNIEDKATALDMDAGLQLSFLAGLVDVAGAARFLHNDKTSDENMRITLQYKCTTRFDQLSMAQLNKDNLQHPDVVNRGLATHVVTGLLFGANAHLVFDLQTSDKENTTFLENELKAAVTCIPHVGAGVHTGMRVGKDDHSVRNRIEVTFFGDFQPSTNPTNYDEAAALFRDLPNQFGENHENAVPVKAWLYPLNYFATDENNIKLTSAINPSLVSRAANCIEQLQHMIGKCKHLSENRAYKTFSGIAGKLRKFRKMVDLYKRILKSEIATLLPKMRAGDSKDEDLRCLISRHEGSPFSLQRLERWVNYCRDQLHTMSSYLDTLADPDQEIHASFAKDSGDFLKLTMSPSCQHCMCFAIQLNTSDTLLDDMDGYLTQYGCPTSDSPGGNARTVEAATVESAANPSLANRLGESTMAERANRFRAFHHENADSKNTVFIVAEDEDIIDPPGATIQLYERGKLTNPDFQIPSPLEAPECESSGTDIEVTWKKPDNGAENITGYKVICKPVGKKRPLVEHESPADVLQCILTDLKPGIRYAVSVKAVCVAGCTAASPPTKLRTACGCSCCPSRKGQEKDRPRSASRYHNNAHGRGDDLELLPMKDQDRHVNWETFAPDSDKRVGTTICTIE